MKIPQLRILVTSFCNRKCLYCRPTGEGMVDNNLNRCIGEEKALLICKLYKENGGNEVKISGGDPIFWEYLVSFVGKLKHELNFAKVEVITRSPKIEEKVHALVDAGMDVLNFSLDTIDKEQYKIITDCDDYDELISTIIKCAKVVPTKINSVIMKGINDLGVDDLISFCATIGVKQLKLLDVIDDLQNKDVGNGYRLDSLGVKCLSDLYISLEQICSKIKEKSVSDSIVYQGGLGHPMNEFKMASGLTVTVKNSENGAWYGKLCENCNFYPCHDALMAIRLTSDNRLQFCLLNNKASIALDGLSTEEISRRFSECLKIYENASFCEWATEEKN